MKRGKNVFAFSLLTSVLLFVAACGGGNPDYVLPTLAPTYTPTPKLSDSNGPTPTPAPDANYTRVIELDGEDYNQTSFLAIRGSGSISVKQTAQTGSYSFCVSARQNTSDGATLEFVNKNGSEVDVVGKVVHVATWVYHESGAPADFAINLHVRKSDNTSDTPSRLDFAGIPSNTWTLIEGDMEVYSNVKKPSVSIEMSSSKEAFYFDNIRLTYDETSAVASNPAYDSAAFERVYYDFEDQQVHLDQRGTSTLSVVSAGEGGDGSCLHVTGRTNNWNGVQVDLSEYNLSGQKIWVTYSAKHDGKQKTKVDCTIQYRLVGSEQDKYAKIVTPSNALPGIWAECSGSITVEKNVESVVIYFETGGTEDFYVDNVMISPTDPSVVVENPGGNGGDNNVPLEEIDLSKYVTIHSLNADSTREETLVISSRGSSSPTVTSNGHSGKGFLVSGRTASWNGVGFDFVNLNNESFDVIGKRVYISMWVYQDSGEPLEISATLQVNKPDGSTAWPERVANSAVPSGKWTHLEGTVPVYANVLAPLINVEIPNSATADFILDDIVISYDPTSSIDPNPDYVEAPKLPFPTVDLDFEDNNVFFGGRGNSTPSIERGGHESDKCMAVKGRTSSWHGVEAGFTEYDVAGKTIEVSYWVCHEYSTPLVINMTAQQSDGATTSYIPVVESGELEDGKWHHFSATYTVPEDVKAFSLYFESPSPTAEFFVDDVLIQLQK